MGTTPRAITEDSLGAWLLKTSDDDQSVASIISTGFTTVTERCVRPTYRADLVAPGQSVLLWISGSSRVHPAGIYAAGHTTGSAERSGSQLVMPMRLRSLPIPVLRRDLLEHPSLSRIEVLRMPAGSNPSFVTPDDLAALEAGWPQVANRTA